MASLLDMQHRPDLDLGPFSIGPEVVHIEGQAGGCGGLPLTFFSGPILLFQLVEGSFSDFSKLLCSREVPRSQKGERVLFSCVVAVKLSFIAFAGGRGNSGSHHQSSS